MKTLTFVLLAQVVWFSPDKVTVTVGETARVRLESSFMWSAADAAFTLTERDASIIRVTGKARLRGGGTMFVTGLRPGRSRAFIAEFGPSTTFVDVTVRCGEEPPVQAAEPLQSAKINEPVTLRAVTPIAERTTFTWYHGLVGDLSAPIAASGPELVFATSDAGVQHAWVLATTPCSSSMAQFAIEAAAPKRRSVRH